ncbi:lysozyme inhibitor LprI family protein [Pseudobutyrivibrio ruminis]|uniref:lysozyme inhibitor LprI family protein n=1 Tax=Pseudobutyrivibrio ruminis TaxID=46206 RepID=UPI000418C222|nr:lysozyme inhibitor LprI family protein [Pseudobutyrivibrio ruminis]
MSKRRKKRMQRRISIILIIVALVLVAGCGVYYLVKNSDSKDEITENTTKNTDVGTVSKDSNNAEDNKLEKVADDDSTLTFEDLAQYGYSFYSGAGGWEDDFDIEKDGSFHGSYHDSDMGDTGDGYPDGTFYYCEYEGHFEDIQKVDEFTYKMHMKDINIINNDGEYIADGVKYIPVTPYALNNADEIEIYMPGKPVSEIDEEVQRWIFIETQDQQDTLDNLALVNVNENQGITSYTRMTPKEDAESTYNTYKESYDYYADQLSEAATTADMVEATSNQIRVSDECLNDIWRIIKYNTDEATFNKALEEQRQWLKDRDASADRATAEHLGGSQATVDYNDIYATMTMERCKELLKYFN